MKRVINRPMPCSGRMLATVSLSMLLGACASMPQQESVSRSAAAARSMAQAQNAAESQVPDDNTPAVSGAEQAGINREGRVIQFGRLAEQVPAVPAAANNNNVVELNYEQEDLRLVLEQLGSVLDLNMLIDPTIDARVSLRTSPDNPMGYEDIWPLIRLLARNAGVSVEQSGAVWQFRKSAGSVPSEIVLPGWLNEAQAGVVLQVTPLKYISVEAASNILQPMLDEGSLLTLGSANLLGISAPVGQLQRINALLSVVDDDPFQNQGIQLYELLNSPAADVAEELTGVLQLIEGEQPSYQVLALERINAVLVVAPASRGFEEVSRWIRILDADSGDQVEQLFVYRVKNLKAESLADTLTKVFDQEDEENTVFRTENQQAGVPTGNGLTPQGGFLATLVSAAGQDAASANITVTIVHDEETNSLLIRATPREYRQLLTTISSLDRVTPQVLINAVIGQVTLTEGNRFGIDWTRISGNLASGPAELSANFLPNTIFDGDGNITAGSGLVLTRSFMDGSAVIDATLNAIAEDNEVTLLARPTILAINNKEGRFHVGQSVPVNNGTTIGTGGNSIQNIGYQNVGIDLIITPQINDDGYIRMDIEQTLSSVEEGATGVADNPTFTDQEIITSVVVADQSTITLGGLIQEEDSDQQSGIPGLQRIPVMGKLFSYNDLRRSRRELFVILRPQIIYGDQRDENLLREHRETYKHVQALLKEAGL